jgi:hypothetical protein
MMSEKWTNHWTSLGGGAGNWYNRIEVFVRKTPLRSRVVAIFCMAVNTEPLELCLIGLTAVLGHLKTSEETTI